MNEIDDRLEGDLVWELFAYPSPRPAQRGSRFRRYGTYSVVLGLMALSGTNLRRRRS